MLDDPINHPKHYTNHPSGIECIQITRHMGFNLGNAIKYIWRADLKGNSIEDLKKAVWYINDEIQKRDKNQEDIEVNNRVAKPEVLEALTTIDEQNTLAGWAPPPGVREPDNRPPVPPAPCLHEVPARTVSGLVNCLNCGAWVVFDAENCSITEYTKPNTEPSAFASSPLPGDVEEAEELPGFDGKIPDHLLKVIDSGNNQHSSNDGGEGQIKEDLHNVAKSGGTGSVSHVLGSDNH